MSLFGAVLAALILFTLMAPWEITWLNPLLMFRHWGFAKPKQTCNLYRFRGGRTPSHCLTCNIKKTICISLYQDQGLTIDWFFFNDIQGHFWALWGQKNSTTIWHTVYYHYIDVSCYGQRVSKKKSVKTPHPPPQRFQVVLLLVLPIAFCFSLSSYFQQHRTKASVFSFI